MPDFQLVTPVAFFVFNRPDTTARVFETIRKIRPQQLLVVADGPRDNHSDDVLKCKQVRQIIAEKVDWECDVITNYASTNMGCGKRVATGLTWVFEQVEEAIILEDDCLPDPSFFRFCQELLEKYRRDARIGMISGDNFQTPNHSALKESYYFSAYVHIWGWATWRRAWANFDYAMQNWSEIKKHRLLCDVLSDSASTNYWSNLFDLVQANKIDTWDYRWVFACWSHRQMSITPTVNLISNIGFGPEATHTKETGKLSLLATEPIQFPLCHPNYVMRNINADTYTTKLFLQHTNLLSRIVSKCHRLLKGFIHEL